MSEEKVTEEKVTEEKPEEKANPDPQDEEVVTKVMAERKEKKKPKRKVVKSNDGLNNFLKSKKIKSSKKETSKTEGVAGLETKYLVIGGLVAAGIAAAVSYKQKPNTNTGAQRAPESVSQQTAAPPPVAPVSSSDTSEDVNTPSWLEGGV